MRKLKPKAKPAGPAAEAVADPLEERDAFRQLLAEYPPGLLPSQCRFLDAFRQTGYVHKAGKIAGVGFATHFRWLDSSVIYRECFERIKETYGNMLEAKVMEQALHGTVEPVYYKGEIVGYVRKFDHKLQMQLLRRFKPEYDYAVPTVDKRRLMAPTGNEVVVHVAGDATFSIDDRRARLLAILDQERERRAANGDVGASVVAPVNGNGHHGNGQNGNGKH